MSSKTLFEKVWNAHVVKKGGEGENDLLFVDLHLLHEVTSPIAFDNLRTDGRKVRHPELTIAVEDHNTPTCNIFDPIKDQIASTQLEAIRQNSVDFGVRLHSLGDPDNGVIHVTFPDLSLVQPGMTLTCGDSHTATHGAFGVIAMGIGTSEVEHVLATQTIWQKPLKTMRVNFVGKKPAGATSKDMILALIAKIGTGGGQGYAIEYTGEAISALSMDERMTISNMTIECGARVGIIAPDQTTFDFIKSRPHAPENSDWDDAIAYWSTLKSDDDAKFDKEVTIDVSSLGSYVTWGTNPGQGVTVEDNVPVESEIRLHASDEGRDEDTDVAAWQKALAYHDLTPGTPMKSIDVDTVFIGSCTNGRIEDLRLAAAVIDEANKQGKKMQVKRTLIVPGSGRIRIQAEKEGLDKIFKEFGAQWRNAGCSMCLGMNQDRLADGERSASTSNRNFENRQGRGGRTHLVSPPTAAATAILGHFGTVEDAVGSKLENLASLNEGGK
jgi:3-isopropylmalate/(R)-2-methylmalate dehydratase large subunit